MTLTRSEVRPARILGLVAPFLVLALGVWLTATFTDAEEARELENAGRTFNHKIAEDGVSLQMEKMLDAHEPYVLVLGPSYANTDSDAKVLAEELGVPVGRVFVIAVPNSVGAHWLAILKHRVFGAGHRPKLVVMLSGLQSMLLTSPLTEASRIALTELLPPEGDPQVTGRSQSGWDLRVAQLQEHRGQVRGAFFGTIRDLPPYLLFPSNDEESYGMLPDETRAALDRVFADSELDMALQRQGTPILEIDREERTYRPEMLPPPEESFLGDITRFTREQGARIIWVRPPMSPFIPDELDDVVLPGVQERAVAIVEAAGGSFVDMRNLPMSTDMYKNEDHMNAEGGRRFSRALARALLDADRNWPALQAAATLDGAPVDLAPGLVVPAGGTLEVRLAEPWDLLRGPVVVDLVADAIAAEGVEGAGAPPVVTGFSERGERGFTVRPDAIAGVGPVWVVREGSPVPVGAWGVRIRATGGPVAVRSLGFGEDARRGFVVGDARASDGPVARLFGVVRLEEGVLVDHGARPTFRSPPPPIPGKRGEIGLEPQGVAYFEAKRLALLSDERLIGETNYGSRCSPIRVTEDGRPLPLANVSCRDVYRKGGGRSCHGPERVLFTTVDGSDPRRNGRQYDLVLDPARACDGAAWLYPKDALSVAFPPDALATFDEPARWLRFGARYLNFRAADLRVRLLVDGAPVLDVEVGAKDLVDGARTWGIDPPVDVRGRSVVLEVVNLDNTFYLVDEATLSARTPGRNNR